MFTIQGLLHFYKDRVCGPNLEYPSYSYEDLFKQSFCQVTIDSFHIVSAHAPNCLVPRYLREITREGATVIRLPYITLWNMENY